MRDDGVRVVADGTAGDDVAVRILIVDDETELAALLAEGLRDEGYDPLVAHDGIQAMSLLRSETVGLAVVDVAMPGMSGFELTAHIKQRDPSLAVILLTARSGVDDRVRGLDVGADDYLVKPFAFAELSARIRAIRRRDALSAPPHLEFGAVSMDLTRHRVSVGGRPLALSRTEFDVLRALAARRGETIERTELLVEVWNTDASIDPNIVDQYISFLRRKLAAVDTRVRIATVRRVGFRLEAAS